MYLYNVFTLRIEIFSWQSGNFEDTAEAIDYDEYKEVFDKFVADSKKAKQVIFVLNINGVDINPILYVY